ncbi:MAG: hypothetical protein NVSMB7_13260 [Chitinophagaceae bacterium]
MQSCKELLVLATLGYLVWRLKKKSSFHLIDWLVLAYFCYTLLYVFIPLGTFPFMDRVLALKGLSFFPFIYFAGRLIDARKIDLNKYFHYICAIAIAAAIVLFFEVIFNQHLQTFTGYAAFNDHFFSQDPSGNYGLSWTFETANGLKRFASFFGGPLELGTNTLCTAAVIIALSTRSNNQLQPDKFTFIAFCFTVFSIIFALSRAAFASYFIMLYVYAFITERKSWLKVFHYGGAAVVVVVLFWLKGDVYDLIMNTIDFSDASSAWHVYQWLDGLDAMTSHPLGLGLGMAGRISGALGSNIGGENQLIIIGVQAGLIAMGIYIAIYVCTLRLCNKLIRTGHPKVRRLALALLLLKVGLIIPMFTANVESYIYISYITWFFSGLVVNMAFNAKQHDSRS